MTFLAIMELIRESLVDFVQAEPFAPIHVRVGKNAKQGIRDNVDLDAQYGGPSPEEAFAESSGTESDEEIRPESS